MQSVSVFGQITAIIFNLKKYIPEGLSYRIVEIFIRRKLRIIGLLCLLDVFGLSIICYLHLQHGIISKKFVLLSFSITFLISFLLGIKLFVSPNFKFSVYVSSIQIPIVTTSILVTLKCWSIINWYWSFIFLPMILPWVFTSIALSIAGSCTQQKRTLSLILAIFSLLEFSVVLTALKGDGIIHVLYITTLGPLLLLEIVMIIYTSKIIIQRYFFL